jgi:cytochrome c-type biogenesis protein CcmH
MMRTASPEIFPTVIPAKAGIQCLSSCARLDNTKAPDDSLRSPFGPSAARMFARPTASQSRLRGDDGQNAMIVLIALLLSLAVSLFSPHAFAQAATDATPLQFSDASEERRFHALVSELRCVMCQNQSLADSNAQIAHDLRREVLALMRQGKSDAEVKQFLVARYGEFVLYKPQVGARTWLLWFGPAVLVLLGGIVIARIVRRRGEGRAVPADDGQEW